MLRWAVVRTYALLTIASTLTACATQLGRKVVNDENTRAPASTKIDAEIFLKELCQRRFKLIEFAYLRDWGVRNGVRIYAAGGTAAGLAHYVKDDLEREAEEKLGETDRFFKSRFGYDYYDVYRSKIGRAHV